uniref:mitogen-activated protein kinase kinase n=1 Tax=Acrobeloides nanus TaxID=290746 RepID=A0A914D1R3_9BILA
MASNILAPIMFPNTELPSFDEIFEDDDVNNLVFPNDDMVYIFKMEDLSEPSVIGSSMHVVRRYLHIPSGNFMAVKQIHVPVSRYLDEAKEKRLRKLNLEIHTHREIANSPYIVDFYGLCLHEGCALVCMELMDVSLHGLLTTCHNSGKNIPEDLLGYTAVSILEALKVCKSKGIIHRDVKPENILMKKSGEIKLADFGESRFVGESQKVTTIGAGTIRYWPPERLHTERTKYDIRSDIWSFGITLAEMAYGKYPIVHADFSDIDFQTVGFITLQNRILEANADEIINRCVRSKYSEDLCEFIWLCLQKLEDRVDVEELIETELYERSQARNTKWVVKLILRALDEYDFTNDPNLYEKNDNFSAENNFYEPAKNTNHHFLPSISYKASSISIIMG